jgi:hypothetical protein
MDIGPSWPDVGGNDGMPSGDMAHNDKSEFVEGFLWIKCAE